MTTAIREQTNVSLFADFESFLSAVKAMKPCYMKAPSVPVLGGVKLSWQSTSLTISAFNYDVYASQSIGADASGNGEIVVNYGRLVSALTAATKLGTAANRRTWTLTIKALQAGIELHVNGVVTTLPAMELGDYPRFDPKSRDGELVIESSCIIDAEAFKTGLKHVLVSPLNDKGEFPILQCVNFSIVDKNLELLSTDRFRITRATFALSRNEAPGVTWRDSVSIPASLIKAMAPLLSGDTIWVSREGRDSQWLSVSDGTRSYSFVGLDEEYPKVRGLFPTVTTFDFEVDADVMLGAAKVGISALGGSVSKAAKLGNEFSVKFTLADGESVMDAAASTFSFSTTNNTENPLTIAFNPLRLTELLAPFKNERMRIVTKSASTPAMFEHANGGTIQHLLMPIRLP